MVRRSTRVALWIAHRLVHDNRRLLTWLEEIVHRLSALQSRLAIPPHLGLKNGLRIGSPAPAFHLPDLNGQIRCLTNWHRRRLLLIFLDPASEPCQLIAAHIAAMPVDDLVMPLPVVVSTGSAETTHNMAHQYDWRCPVLLQQKLEVAALYAIEAVPAAYLISEQGTIDSDVAMGVDAISLLWTRVAAPAAAEHRL